MLHMIIGLDSTSRALDEAERQLRMRSTSPKIDERGCSQPEAAGQQLPKFMQHIYLLLTAD